VLSEQVTLQNMSSGFSRTVIVYGKDFWEFYNEKNPTVQKKIDWLIDFVRTERIIPEKFFKHLSGTDGLFELRIKVGTDIFRIFCFFDRGNLVILLNGFQKKTDKTPKSEIKRAEDLKKHYYEDKKKK
jgi:phage-related protein